MLVKDFMVTSLVTMESSELVARAKMLLEAKNIRHLPVVEQGSIVGIVSDRDISRAMAIAESMKAILDVDTGSKVTLGEIMVSDIISVEGGDRLTDAAKIMLDKKISCLPVIEGGALVGLITETDIIRQFISMTAQ